MNPAFYQLQEQSMRITPMLAVITLLGFLTLVLLNRKTLWRYAKKATENYILLLAAVFALGLFIRIFYVQHYYLMWTDEAVYMQTAQSILHHLSQGYYQRSIGWPLLIAVMFIFKTSNWVPLYASSLLGSLTIVNIYFIVYSLTKEKRLGIFAAFVMSIIYTHVRWSTSAETNVASLFFISLSVLLSLIYYRRPSGRMLWLCAFTYSFTALLRPENYMFALLFFIGLLLYHKKELAKPAIYIPWLLVGILVLPNLYNNFLFSMDAAEGQLIMEGRGYQGFLEFIPHSVGQVLDLKPTHKALVLLIALFSIAGLVNPREPQYRFLYVWAALSLFYMGAFFEAHVTHGCFERTYIDLLAPVAVFFSIGLGRAGNLAKKYTGYLVGLVMILMLILAFDSIDNLRYKPEPTQVLAMMLPETAEKDIPEDCLIVTNHPELIECSTELSAIGPEIFLDNPSDFSDIDCILFLKGGSCRNWWEGEYVDLCDNMSDYFSERYITYYYEGKNITFYRLDIQ